MIDQNSNPHRNLISRHVSERFDGDLTGKGTDAEAASPIDLKFLDEQVRDVLASKQNLGDSIAAVAESLAMQKDELNELVGKVRQDLEDNERLDNERNEKMKADLEENERQDNDRKHQFDEMLTAIKVELDKIEEKDKEKELILETLESTMKSDLSEMHQSVKANIAEEILTVGTNVTDAESRLVTSFEESHATIMQNHLQALTSQAEQQQHAVRRVFCAVLCCFCAVLYCLYTVFVLFCAVLYCFFAVFILFLYCFCAVFMLNLTRIIVTKD